MPVIFITDALFLLLIVCTIGFAAYARRFEHLRAPWRIVARAPLAMAAAVVLAAYTLVAVLDSLHFQERLTDRGQTGEVLYSPEILSVLDYLLTPLRERVERSYSAPFATHAFTKESVEQSDLTKLRIYPRLAFGGAHLADPLDRGGDIMILAIRAVAESAVILALVFVVLGIVRGRVWGIKYKAALGRLLHREPDDAPWLVILITMGLIITAVMLAARIGVKYHLLGTDKVGQDVFFQSLKSIRTGLIIGTLTTLLMLPFAVALGLMAGYLRGIVDDVIQYLYTTLNSIPGVLLISASILGLQVYLANHADEFVSLEQRSDLRLLFLCTILGITSWTGLCRLLRGETLKLREIDYIEAAQAFGVSGAVIMIRHILPNVLHIVMIAVVLDFSGLVLAEAVLSYINIGVDPSMHSWGNMINSARLEMAREPVVWWSLTAAFLFMFLLVLAANLFADAVRDAFDPRLRTIDG